MPQLRGDSPRVRERAGSAAGEGGGAMMAILESNRGRWRKPWGIKVHLFRDCRTLRRADAIDAPEEVPPEEEIELENICIICRGRHELHLPEKNE